jgi:hypothetical protein
MSYLDNDVKQFKEWEEKVYSYYLRFDEIQDRTFVGYDFRDIKHCHNSDGIYEGNHCFYEKLGYRMIIQIGYYSMIKFCSHYEYMRWITWKSEINEVNSPFKYRLSSFDEFNQIDWLNQWLNRIIPRCNDLVRHADKMFKKYHKKSENEDLERQLDKLSINEKSF